MLSYFGRVQYNFSETYLFNATFRSDGSSKFADGNRWGYFPSFSGGWVITNEDFMKGFQNAIPYFKLRASWGQNGSSNASAFNYLAPISFINGTYNFGSDEGVNTTGSYPSRLSNEKLKWETSEQLDIGFDAGFLDNRLMVNFDFYKKITKDWLIVAPVLATAGTDAPYINGGNVHNTGVELALSYEKNEGEFRYQVNVVGSYNKNNVTDIPTEDGIIHGATNTLYANSSEFYRAETGHAIGYFWGWETDGIFQTSDEVKAYVGPDGRLIQSSAKPGDLRYVDQNSDGVINDLDKIDLGDPNPNFIFGLNFAANWKGFDFSLITNGVAGNQIVQSNRSPVEKFSNYSVDILERWTGTGTSTTVPRVTNSNVNYKFSDIFVQNGSYFRISNITLGYDIAKLFKTKSFQSLRVYASVQNLYTLTSYTGMDPEVGYGLDNGITDQFSSGIDLGYYPRPRTILFGISVKY
jgi:TonB-linked SusC/RagA family outer membrane protein